MGMFYSKSSGGFYNKEINGSNIPKDAVEINFEQYDILMQSLSAGKVIKSTDEGYPVVDDHSFSPLSEKDIEILRLIAYADPISGSDRYFAEALALQSEGFGATSVEVKELKQKGLVRKEEIKFMYPKP